VRWTRWCQQCCRSFHMLITSSDFARVAYAPKVFWARLTRGPEPEESPGARLIEPVWYKQVKERFVDCKRGEHSVS
jgi:hypothetical protein